MLTTPTIKIFYEVGKHVALKARGVAALIIAIGFVAALVTVSQNMAQTSRKAQNWIAHKFTEQTKEKTPCLPRLTPSSTRQLISGCAGSAKV